MIKINSVEQVSEGLLTIASQLPPLVKDGITPMMNSSDQSRNFRQQLFNALNSQFEFTMDQLHAYALVEFLDLGIKLNPPVFDPSKTAPTQIAGQKANSYLSTYLMNQYLTGINQLGFDEDLINELAIDAGDLYLTQINRLQYNYNHRFNVAGYLKEIKNRIGLLDQILVKEAVAFDQKMHSESRDLLIQIGQELGVINYLQLEQEVFDNPARFKERIITGFYPLAFFFAEKEDFAWFRDFFNQSHKPSEQQFNELKQRCYDLGYEEAANVIDDMLKQVHLDWQVLPEGSIKEKLKEVIVLLETN